MTQLYVIPEKAGLEIGDEELAEQFAEEDVQGHSAEI